MILFPHGPYLPTGMDQVEAIRDAIRSDDRFTWVPVDDKGKGDINVKVDQSCSSSIHTNAQEVTVLVRTSRTNRYDAGNDIAKLLENESIPQYLWPAARPFARWLMTSKGKLVTEASTMMSLEGKTILEIGSGAGLCGFAAAACCNPKLVVVTDCSPVAVAMLEESRVRNESSSALPSGRVRVAALKWGDDDALRRLLEMLDIPKFDVVMGSDVFYFRNSLSDGLSTAYRSLVGFDGGNPDVENSMRGGLFLCSSFVRSQRMDEDIDTIPQTFGFQRQRVQLVVGEEPPNVATSAGDDDDGDGGLRIYAWST
ncbi:methyltransferase family 16, putative [Bodo saltans]|uniref:Methyltransferase family 16, putative n=1 Tax=Bodo saltans TaxID=75058 RepID=A0A0S4J1S6_BODSA|nr:methyltransferase family 16, putative [Bodo saltans]|eukprot:CUG58378.1 methyltransferase family 16, putative [Bodo saltans]